ncbi:MAG TPA: glycoside hydrolase [Bacteroidaceae bacterium]|nr:glycoside hydrolase [Bacteroidaceae bacterium]
MKNTIYTFSLLAFCTACSACSRGVDLPLPNGQKNTTDDGVALVVDVDKTYQTMEGFGASDCWSGNYVGRDWDESKRASIADLLFSQDIEGGHAKGIGLSMWRSNLGAGSANQGDNSGISDKSRRAECFLKEDGSYDWTQAAGQQYFMQQAKAKGCESFVLFSNSAPVWYTLNGKGYSSQGANANLQSDKYDDFAQYMVTVAKHYEELGIPIDFISPVNEPQYNWADGGQEGSGWTNAQVASLTRELDSALSNESLNTKILLSEAASYEYLYENKGDQNRSNVIADFFDANSANYIGNLSHVPNIIGGHAYWNDSNWSSLLNTRTNFWTAASARNLKTYQTEWSMLGDGYDDSHFVDYDKASYMDIAMYMTQVMYHDIVTAHVSSWSFWTAMDVERWGHKDRFLLISLVPSGGVDGDISNSGTYAARKTLWALGNYSLFVRPGYTRVDISSGIDRDLFGSAFISPDQNKLVVVLTNYNKIKKVFVPQINGFKATTIMRYVTSETSDLQEDKSSLDAIEVPAHSVTTFVLSK